LGVEKLCKVEEKARRRVVRSPDKNSYRAHFQRERIFENPCILLSHNLELLNGTKQIFYSIFDEKYFILLFG